MAINPSNATRPPQLLKILAHLLIRGRDAPYIVGDLDASFARDIERGLRRGKASGRYMWNVLASVWSVWTTGVRGLITHGVGLDVRLGLRMLAKQRLITAVTVLTLGLGIPGSLTLVHAGDVLYGDLPIPDADRVVGIRHYDIDIRRPQRSTVHDYEYWREFASFESVGATRSYTVNVNAENSGAPVLAAEVTASTFDILQAPPLRGRVFNENDEVEGGPDLVLIGEDLWSARFGRDPDIVGTSIRIGRTPHTVIGIMPSGFGFPLANQVWLPFRGRALDFPEGEGPHVLVFGRLASETTVDEAKAEVAVLIGQRATEDPERFEHFVGELVRMPVLLLNMRNQTWTHPEFVTMQLLIFGLLLVVCGNVGTLILARTAARSSEITIRTALGASRSRILTQLFVEALLLTLVATTLGLLGANAVTSRIGPLLGPMGPEFSYWWVDFTLTPRIVAAAIGLAVFCAVVVGVLPTLSSTRQAIQANLQNVAQRGGSVRFGVGSSLLIVGEIVLSVGFLALGATAVKSTFARQDGDAGFDPERFIVGTWMVPELDPMDTPSPSDSAAWEQRVTASQRALLTELSGDPAVVGVAMGQDAPGLRMRNRDVVLETPPAGFEPVPWDTRIPRVDVSFFAGLNRPIVAGRDFSPQDVEGPSDRPPTAVIVNESFVRDVLGGRNAVGQRLRHGPQGTVWGQLEEGEWYEIVGVVEAFGINPSNPERDAAIYHPLAPGEINPVRYTVEVAGDPEAFIPQFRRIATSIDPDATLTQELISNSIQAEALTERSMFLVVLALAFATFLLSATGLYALMSFTVSQRTREIGIRSALGAGAAAISSTIARRAALQIGVGLALGIVFAWVLLTKTEFGFDMGNIPLTLTLTAAVAACICVLACAHPTLRGLRIQPTEALRES